MRELKVFKATWCQPCKQLTPTLEELQGEGYKVEMLDVDDNKDAVADYGIRSVPTTLVLEGDQVLERLVGNKTKQEILSALEE